MPFFGSIGDSALRPGLVLNQPDLYVSKHEVESSGVASIATNDVTLTPAVSPAWTVSAYVSTVGLNVLVVGNNNKRFIGKVKSNTATGFTFDATALKNVADGTAGTAGDFTAASTYSFQILTANATNMWGAFFGYVKELGVNMNEEVVKFEYGTPAVIVDQAIVKREYMMKGKHHNVSSQDVMHAVLGSRAYGSQTAQWEEGFGFVPDVRDMYRITAVGKTVAGKEMAIQFFKCQLKLDGDFSMSGNEYKGLGFQATALRDVLRDSAVDAGRIWTAT